MCGRYGFIPGHDFYRRFNISNRLADLSPRYNASPGQLMVVVTCNSPNQAIVMKWGLIPHWASDPRIGYQMINARVESIKEKPAFRKPFLTQRCLVPASGFYEWKKTGTEKIPYYIYVKDRQLISFAGLYDIWADAEGREIRSYTIITTVPNETVSSIHDRMPAILEEKDENNWLNPEEKDAEELLSLLKPYKERVMEAFPVSKAVNKAENDNEELIKQKEYPDLQERLFS